MLLPVCSRLLFPLLHAEKGQTSLFCMQQRKEEMSAPRQEMLVMVKELNVREYYNTHGFQSKHRERGCNDINV